MVRKNYFKEVLLPMRMEIIAEIKKAVNTFKTKRIELGVSCYENCPILAYGRDDEDVFTLDCISINKNGKVIFEGSSSWENDTWSEDNIGTDNLVEIYNELDDIVEWCKECEEDWA